MKFTPIQCPCGAQLFFRKELLSRYENFDEIKHNKKPLEVQTGKVHECPKRGWSIPLKCNGCHGPIRFNNAIKSASGIKIPHGLDLTPHVCRTIA